MDEMMFITAWRQPPVFHQKNVSCLILKKKKQKKVVKQFTKVVTKFIGFSRKLMVNQPFRK